MDSLNVDIYEGGTLTEQRTYYFEKIDSFMLRGLSHMGASSPNYYETLEVSFKTEDDQNAVKIAVSTFNNEYANSENGSLIIDMGNYWHGEFYLELGKIELKAGDQLLTPTYHPFKVMYNIESGIERVYYTDSSKVWLFYK